MKVLKVFESRDALAPRGNPAETDPLVLAFREDLAWVAAWGFTVEHGDPREDPGVIAGLPTVQAALDQDGEDALPLLFADGQILASGEYPTRVELAAALGLTWHEPQSAVNAVVGELVALAAAVASDCPPAFQHHLQRSRRLGVSREDLLKVVNIGFSVKSVPHRSMIEMAERFLLPPRGGQGGCASGNCGSASGEAPCDPDGCDCSASGCGCQTD
jgi:AhpD family alkylhydroperoxidase